MQSRVWRNLGGLILTLTLWELVYRSGFISPLLFAGPVEVFRALLDPHVSRALLSDAAYTLGRAVLGFILGSATGTVLGLILGMSGRLYDLCEFGLEFFRSLPASALLPVFMLLFGIGDTSKVLLVAFACALILVVNTAHGVRNRNPTRAMVAQIEGATPVQLIGKVILPEALPSVATGLRLAISLALIIEVVTEMLVSTSPGLGRRILDAQTLFRLQEMYGSVIITGLLGYLLNKFISAVAARTIHWEGK